MKTFTIGLRLRKAGSSISATVPTGCSLPSRKTVMMLDSSKSGGLLPFTFAMPEDVDVLVTDDKLDPEIVSSLEKKIALVL